MREAAPMYILSLLLRLLARCCVELVRCRSSKTHLAGPISFQAAIRQPHISQHSIRIRCAAALSVLRVPLGQLSMRRL